MTETPVESTPVAVPRPRVLPMLAGAVCITALWAVVQLWGLGGIPFHTKGDPREGLVVWEMTHGGGLILPRRNGTELPSKPPLFHWMGASTAVMRGATDEWSIRFPSAALSLAGGLATYAAGAALWGPPAGVIGAAITLTSFEWHRAATSARVDMTLTFGILVALLSYLFIARAGARMGWLIAFYGGLAFAVLAKGPVGLALPVLVIAASCLLTRDLSPLRGLRLVRGAIAVAVIAGSWYVLAVIEGGASFFTKQILNENLYRLASASEFEGGHRHGPLYLLGGFAAGFLPWTLFLPAVAVALWRERGRMTAGDARLYLLLWIAVVFGVYSLAVSKRSVYLLSLYPAAGLLVGWWWARLLSIEHPESVDDPGWLRLVLWPAVAVVLVAMVTLLLGAGLEACSVPVMSWIAGYFSEEGRMYAAWIGAALHDRALASLFLLSATALCFFGLMRALRGGHWRGVFAFLLAALVAADTFTQQIVLPAVASKKSYREFMPAVRAAVGPDATLLFYRTFEYGAVFYWGGHIAEYRGDLSPSAPRYLLMARDEWKRVPPDQRALFELVPFPAPVEEGDGRRLVLVQRRAR